MVFNKKTISSWSFRYNGREPSWLLKTGEHIHNLNNAHPMNDAIISTPNEAVAIHIEIGTAWSTASKKAVFEKAGWK